MKRPRPSWPFAAMAAASILAGCHDPPARPAPRPTAPAQASRAMLEQAMTAAVASAEQARRLVPEPPAPLDDPPRYADALVGDPDADPDDDPGAVTGGIVGGTLGAPNPDMVPAARAADITVQLLSDSDGLDAAVLRRQTILVRLRAEACRRQAALDDSFTDPVTATISISASPRGVRAVHASDAGPLTDCLEHFYVSGDLPAGATLTFQVTVPAP